MISIPNTDDNECFKWTIVRYLNLADRNPTRITKTDKEFVKNFDFKATNFPVKIKDIHEMKNKNFIDISIFECENKKKHQIYTSKKYCQEKHVDSLLKGKEGTRHYVLIKDFNTSMYDHSLHCRRKHFCRYCLQAFSI